MPRGDTFRPIRPVPSNFPRMNPRSFDPREITYLGDLSVSNDKISQVSPRKMKLIGAKVYEAGTQAIPDGLGTWTNVTYDTVAFDQGNLYRAAVPTRLTIPYTGIYLVTAFANFADTPLGQRLSRIRLNGASNLMQYGAASLNTADTPVFVSTTLLLNAGDYIQQQVDQNGGVGDLNLRGGEDDNFFTAIFLGAI